MIIFHLYKYSGLAQEILSALLNKYMNEGIEQMVWILFLKVYDAKEEVWEFYNEDYVSIIPEEFRWRNGAFLSPKLDESRGGHDGCRRGSQAQCYGLMDTKPNGIEKVEFS